MIRRLIASIMVVSVITCCWTSKVTLASPPTSAEQSIKDSKAKYQQLDGEILKLNSQMDELKGEINSLQNKLKKNEEEKQSTKDQIDSINLQLTQSKDQIEKTQNILDGRLRSMYKSNIVTDMLAYALSSENIFDLFTRMQYMGKIVSIDKELIEEIHEKTEFLNQSAKTLKVKETDLKNIENSLNKDISTLNTKQNEQQQVVDKLNSEKDATMAIIEENEKTLISHPLSVINSGSSSVTDLQNAISTLNGLLPQLNSSSAISSAKDAIASGNSRINDLKATEEAKNNPPLNNNNTQGGDGQYKATFSMEATAYANHGTTALGLKPVRDPNGISTVAVDPNVIPLGSKVFIPGYGYAIASDTGGAIKGNIIDLYMNSEAECYSWGRRRVTVHLVAYPGEW